MSIQLSLHPASADRPATLAEPAASRRTSRQLSAAQSSVLDRLYRANEGAIRRAVHRTLPQDARSAVDDVVSVAMLTLVDAVTRVQKPAVLPATDKQFRATLVTIAANLLRNGARDRLRRTEAAPIDSQSVARDRTGKRGRPRGQPRDEQPPGGPAAAENAPLEWLWDVADPFDEEQLEHVSVHDLPNSFPQWGTMSREDRLIRLGELLSEAIETLSPVQQQVIRLTYVRGLRRAAVATALGISVKTYDWYLQVAHERMRTALLSKVPELARSDFADWDLMIQHLHRRYAARQDTRGTIDRDR